jgi:hypothetical protein
MFSFPLFSNSFECSFSYFGKQNASYWKETGIAWWTIELLSAYRCQETEHAIVGPRRYLGRRQIWYRFHPITQWTPNLAPVPADISFGTELSTGASRYLSWHQIRYRCQPVTQSAPNLVPVSANISVGTKFGTGASRFISRYQLRHRFLRFTSQCQIWHRCKSIYHSAPNLAPVQADVSLGTKFGTSASRYIYKSTPNLAPVPVSVSVGIKLNTGVSRYTSQHQIYHRFLSIYHKPISHSAQNLIPVKAGITVDTKFGTGGSGSPPVYKQWVGEDIRGGVARSCEVTELSRLDSSLNKWHRLVLPCLNEAVAWTSLALRPCNCKQNTWSRLHFEFHFLALPSSFSNALPLTQSCFRQNDAQALPRDRQSRWFLCSPL